MRWRRADRGTSGVCGACHYIEEDGEKKVRMAHLAIMGSNSVNGDSALHTEILKGAFFRDFCQMWLERFNN